MHSNIQIEDNKDLTIEEQATEKEIASELQSEDLLLVSGGAGIYVLG